MTRPMEDRSVADRPSDPSRRESLTPTIWVCPLRFPRAHYTQVTQVWDAPGRDPPSPSSRKDGPGVQTPKVLVKRPGVRRDIYQHPATLKSAIATMSETWNDPRWLVKKETN